MPKSRVSRRSRAQRRVTLMRNLAIGFVAVVVVLIAAAGLYYSTGMSTPAELAENTHYQLLPVPAADDPSQPIKVTEFFSYGCVHCRNFEPMLERWYQGQPDDVELERVPVAFSPSWRLLSRTYYALESAGALEQNHDRLFRAIHDRNREFTTPEAVAAFVDGHGVDRDRFLRIFESPVVQRATRQAEQRVAAYQISGVPSLVVNDRYVVTMRTRRDGLVIAEQLIQKIREERGAALAGPAQDDTASAGQAGGEAAGASQP